MKEKIKEVVDDATGELESLEGSIKRDLETLGRNPWNGDWTPETVARHLEDAVGILSRAFKGIGEALEEKKSEG